jgi:hypothetical protein
VENETKPDIAIAIVDEIKKDVVSINYQRKLKKYLI